MSDSTIVDLFLATARSAFELIADPEVADRWDAPSVLPQMSIGALAAHLGRAVETVDRYASSVPPAPGVEPITAAAYVTRSLGDADVETSELHRGIRERAQGDAASGAVACAERVGAALDRLAAAPLAPDRRVEVFGGAVMTVAEYLRTRLVELCVHSADLTASLDRGLVGLPPQAWDESATVVAEVARRRHGSPGFVLGLARTDRSPVPRAF
jgi:hypothetical protein